MITILKKKKKSVSTDIFIPLSQLQRNNETQNKYADNAVDFRQFDSD